MCLSDGFCERVIVISCRRDHFSVKRHSNGSRLRAILKATFTPHRVKVIQGDAGVVPWGCRISVRSHKFTIWQTILKATFTPHPRRCRRLVLFSSLEVAVPHFDHTSPYCLANLHSYSKLANEDHERDAQSQGTLPLELNVPAFIGSLDYPHLVSPIAEFRITLAYSDAHSGRASAYQPLSRF